MNLHQKPKIYFDNRGHVVIEYKEKKVPMNLRCPRNFMTWKNWANIF